MHPFKTTLTPTCTQMKDTELWNVHMSRDIIICVAKI